MSDPDNCLSYLVRRLLHEVDGIRLGEVLLENIDEILAMHTGWPTWAVFCHFSAIGTSDFLNLGPVGTNQVKNEILSRTMTFVETREISSYMPSSSMISVVRRRSEIPAPAVVMVSCAS